MLGERKLDILPLQNLSENSTLCVILQTRSKEAQDVSVNVTLSTWFHKNAIVGGNVLESFIDKPTDTAPSINYFSAFFNSSLNSSTSLDSISLYLRVNVEQSLPYFCTVVSIQSAKNSPTESEGCIKRIGIWQTMLERATFIIDKAEYQEGFYLVVKDAPLQCGILVDQVLDHNNTDIRKDKIKISIKENAPWFTYWFSIGLVSFGYFLVFGISLIMVKTVMDIRIDECFQKTFGNMEAVDKLGEVIDMPDTKEQPNKEDESNVAVKQKNKTDKTLNELSSCEIMENPFNYSSVYQRNQLHWVILIATSMFYYIPTIQMVVDSSNKYKETGNQDYCYYNSLCQMPLGILKDFNHVFSNLGYAVLGLLFMWVLYKKEHMTKLMSKKHGIPRHYSLFYSMGLSLIGISIMSSCYHICPTQVTFQFDTTYMYMLSFFLILKVYQNRHPDLVCKAFKGFLFLGICLGLEVSSLYFYGPVFWVLFTLFYVGSMFAVGCYIYTSGEIHLNHRMFSDASKIFYQNFSDWKQNKFSVNSLQLPRKIFVTFICLMNFGFCIYLPISNPSEGLSSIMLNIFLGNLVSYTIFYIFMKIYCGERLVWYCVVFLVLCTLCFGPAFFFFQSKEKSSLVSAAQSRSLNAECLLFGFFDNHDVWHFLGGYALFFMFMFFLTLDDDLLHVPHDKIPVF